MELPLLTLLAQTSAPASTPDVGAAVQEVADSGVADWIKALISLAAALLIALVVRRLIIRVGRRANAMQSTVQIVSRLISGVLVLTGVYIALRTVGVDLAPALAGAGILGIAFAFAIQDIAQNYMSGVILGFRNPFRPGDIIVTGGQEGVVEELDLRHTVIRGYDGMRILVPNAQVLQNPLVNITISGARRTSFQVGVAYGTNLEKATDIAGRAVRDLEGVQERPPADAVVTGLAGSSVTLLVRYWHSPSTTDFFHLRDRAIKSVVKAFEAEGIEIPFEQRVVRFADDGIPGTLEISSPEHAESSS